MQSVLMDGLMTKNHETNHETIYGNIPDDTFQPHFLYFFLLNFSEIKIFFQKTQNKSKSRKSSTAKTVNLSSKVWEKEIETMDHVAMML